MSRTNWAVLNHYGFPAVELIRETEKSVFYKEHNYTGDKFVERKTSKAFAWRGTEQGARAISNRLVSANALRANRVAKASRQFRETVERLTSNSDVSLAENAEGG